MRGHHHIVGGMEQLRNVGAQAHEMYTVFRAPCFYQRFEFGTPYSVSDEEEVELRRKIFHRLYEGILIFLPAETGHRNYLHEPGAMRSSSVDAIAAAYLATSTPLFIVIISAFDVPMKSRKLSSAFCEIQITFL